MSATFRTAPMGFNKKDVIDYIRQLVIEKDARTAAAWEEYKSLESRMNKQLAALELDMEQERAETAERMAALEEERDAATARFAELETELEAARAAAAKLEEEKALLEERAAGSEKAFADLEQAMNEQRTTHAAELEALHASHAEEVRAIYAERSAQLDKKSAQIRTLEQQNTDKDAEIDSLRKHNLRLIEQTEELEEQIAALEKEAIFAMPDIRESTLSAGAQERFSAFKTRFIEITGELSQLAQAILDAEKREGATSADDGLTFPVDLSGDDLPEGESSEEDDILEDQLAFFDEGDTDEETPADDEEEDDDPVTRIELNDYPAAAPQPPRPVQKKPASVRDLLDRLRAIGDRLL